MDEKEPEKQTQTPEFLETGRIVIRLGIGADGEMKRGFYIDGVDPAAAIGHLTTMVDVIRENQKRSWMNQGGV